MTTKSENSNCEIQSCNFPLSLDDNETNLNNMYHWINSFEFTRQKKTIARDFSDASKNKYMAHYSLLFFFFY